MGRQTEAHMQVGLRSTPTYANTENGVATCKCCCQCHLPTSQQQQLCQVNSAHLLYIYTQHQPAPVMGAKLLTRNLHPGPGNTPQVQNLTACSSTTSTAVSAGAKRKDVMNGSVFYRNEAQTVSNPNWQLQVGGRHRVLPNN